MAFDIKRALTAPKPVEVSPPPPPPPPPAPQAPASAPVTSGFSPTAAPPVALSTPQPAPVAMDAGAQVPASRASPETLNATLDRTREPVAGGPVADASAQTAAPTAAPASNAETEVDAPAEVSAQEEAPDAGAEEAPVADSLNEEERRAYEALSPEDRRQFDQAYREAQAKAPTETSAQTQADGAAAGTSAEAASPTEDLERALVNGAIPAYLDLPTEEQAKADELYRAAERLPEGPQRTEATAAVTRLVKEDQVEAYMLVEESSSEDANLQHLLFNGQLTGNKDKDNKSLLDYLAGFAANGTGNTAQGVNRGELIDQIIRDVRTNSYDQPPGNRDCGPLAVLGEFAGEAPATYARTLTELAETGTTTVKNSRGEEIVLNYKGPPPEGIGQEGQLTSTQDLFTTAFGDYVDRKYGPSGGGILGGVQRMMDRLDGMNALEIAELRELVSGDEYEAMTVPTDEDVDPSDPAAVARQEELREEAKSTIDEQLEADENPVVNIDGHWVKVTGKVNFLGRELYFVDDGTGQRRMVSADYLKSSVKSVVYNTEHSEVPEGSYDPTLDDPGTGSNSGAGGIDPTEGR